MNRVINFYKRYGRKSRKVMSYMKVTPILKGVETPYCKTPGRARYYDTETLHMIPEKILTRFRMPHKFPVSIESTMYLNRVEKEVTKYFGQLSHNLFDPKSGVSLDLTIGQVKKLLKAPEKAIKTAESGELQSILDNLAKEEEKVTEIIDRVEAEMFAIEDKMKGYVYKGFSSSIGNTEPLDPNIPLTEAPHIKKILTRKYYVSEAKYEIARANLDLCIPDGSEVYDKITFVEAQK